MLALHILKDNCVFVICLYQTQHPQEMGRLSEDIMAMFGMKPLDQQTQHTQEMRRLFKEDMVAMFGVKPSDQPVKDATASSPSLGVLICYHMKEHLLFASIILTCRTRNSADAEGLHDVPQICT